MLNVPAITGSSKCYASVVLRDAKLKWNISRVKLKEDAFFAAVRGNPVRLPNSMRRISDRDRSDNISPDSLAAVPVTSVRLQQYRFLILCQFSFRGNIREAKNIASKPTYSTNT